MDRALSLSQEVKGSKHSFPDLVARSDLLSERARRLKKDGDLREEIERLWVRRAALDIRLSLDIAGRKKFNTLGWVSLGIGIVFSAAVVPTVLLGNRAYSNYQSAQVTLDAIYYRKDAALCNALSVGSGITGGITLLLSPFLWRLGPRPEKLREEIGKIEARIEKLEGDLR